MKKMIAFVLATSVVTIAQAQNVVDSSTSFKAIVGPIERGTVIKTANFHYYEITDKVVQKSGWAAQPEIVVYQEGKKYKMKIQGMEKVLSVNKIQEVIESNIMGVLDDRKNVNDFKGYDGTTTFRLQNGQDWAQAETTSNVFTNLFRPAVTIYLTSEGYKMRIEGLKEDPILVKKK